MSEAAEKEYLTLRLIDGYIISSTLKTEGKSMSERSVPIDHTTRRHGAEDLNYS